MDCASHEPSKKTCPRDAIQFRFRMSLRRTSEVTIRKSFYSVLEYSKPRKDAQPFQFVPSYLFPLVFTPSPSNSDRTHRAALQKYIHRGTYKFATVITRKDFKSPCRSGSHNPHQSPHPFRSFRQAFYWHQDIVQLSYIASCSLIHSCARSQVQPRRA